MFTINQMVTAGDSSVCALVIFVWPGWLENGLLQRVFVRMSMFWHARACLIDVVERSCAASLAH